MFAKGVSEEPRLVVREGSDQEVDVVNAFGENDPLSCSK